MLPDFVNSQAWPLVYRAIAPRVPGCLVPLVEIGRVPVGELDVLNEPEPAVILHRGADSKAPHGLLDDTLIRGSAVVGVVVVGVTLTNFHKISYFNLWLVKSPVRATLQQAFFNPRLLSGHPS